jgi:transcriptional regulator with XRE-family HTH domain
MSTVGSIGWRIIEARRSKGWTQRELSQMAGISQPLLSQLESGITKVPSVKTIRLLARALGMSVDALIGTYDTEPVVLTPALAAG